LRQYDSFQNSSDIIEVLLMAKFYEVNCQKNNFVFIVMPETNVARRLSCAGLTDISFKQLVFTKVNIHQQVVTIGNRFPVALRIFSPKILLK